MAVFFYEEDESLLSGARWDEIGRADTGKGMCVRGERNTPPPASSLYQPLPLARYRRLVSENILEGFVQVLLVSSCHPNP
jgi:hypothetical protein